MVCLCESMGLQVPLPEPESQSSGRIPRGQAARVGFGHLCSHASRFLGRGKEGGREGGRESRQEQERERERQIRVDIISRKVVPLWQVDHLMMTHMHTCSHARGKQVAYVFEVSWGLMIPSCLLR